MGGGPQRVSPSARADWATNHPTWGKRDPNSTLSRGQRSESQLPGAQRAHSMLAGQPGPGTHRRIGTETDVGDRARRGQSPSVV